MSSRKNVGQAPTVDDITASMSSRYEEMPATTPETARRPAASSPKTRRSWLLPTDVAEAFAAAADRIHHGSGGRVSKSAAQAAIISAGLAHEAEIVSAMEDRQRR